MDAKRNILVVDDSKQNRRILCRILAAAGYDTTQAENGLEAYKILCAGQPAVSLVLLDIVMPVMDGYELLKKMNETGIIASVPVIVMTGNEREETEIRCLDSGASDFLRKPYNAELLRHRVKSLLRLFENAALINQLETDRLTGLPNKEGFYRHAEEMLAKYPDEKYDLIYVDIDGFKMINARYGISAGDELLKFFAARYAGQAGDKGVCGRIGADIFAVLKCGEETRTQDEVRETVEGEMKEAPVKGFSYKCGIYRVRDRSISIADMCDRAKLALETIKNQYGVYYTVYNDAMRDKALRNHQLANCMEDALEKKQFLVYLQPKHNTETGAVAGAEALVRWFHPEMGFLTPGEFIPLFEKTGFISKLDFYMWTEVCRILKHWIESGQKPISVSVNASRADFSAFDLPQRIEKLVDSYGLPHELLHFEVTESAYTQNPAQIIAAASSLRDMGFKIEMDDFGSGYSSLNMLSELPIDILKLDMRFLQHGSSYSQDGKRNILSFIISLSKWLQLPTVAEGVETREEVDMLKSMGCDYIQGFYYSKPIPADDFEEYMKNNAGHDTASVKKPTGIMLPTRKNDTDEKPHILIVEDIESNREILCDLLQSDYEIAVAENVAVADEYIKKHIGELDCILLDLLMPVMDGFQLLDILRANGTLDEIPVVITTEAGKGSDLRALHLGADSFVAKPYEPEILLHHVKKAVDAKRLKTEMRRFELEKASLYKAAYLDELTGLLNRHGLNNALAQLPRDERRAEIMLDIDNLKLVNDMYGHLAGDEIIRAVAAVLRGTAKDGDIVARVGGDEFIIITAAAADGKEVLKAAQSLCSDIRNSVIKGFTVRPSCSAGVTVAETGEDSDEVYRRVDEALYEAKKTNKGTCCIK